MPLPQTRFYRSCACCGKPFTAYRYYGETRGFFCSCLCRGRAMKIFNQLLVAGKLPLILEQFERLHR